MRGDGGGVIQQVDTLRSSALAPLLACRPMAQRVLSIKPLPGQTEIDAAAAQLAAPWAFDPAAQQAPQQYVQQQHAQQQGQQQYQAPAVLPPPPGMGSFAASGVQAGQPHVAGRQPPAVGAGDDERHPLTMAVSAVAAGWAPDRSGKAPTGSGECQGLGLSDVPFLGFVKKTTRKSGEAPARLGECMGLALTWRLRGAGWQATAWRARPLRTAALVH